MAKPKILIADPISEIGIDELKADPQLDVVVQIGIKEPDLLATVDQYDGIIVRSQTKITAPVLDRATKLKAVGRAGVGVDNIDVAAATTHGVVVMNTPGGNTISTAEHAFTLMVSLARHIPQAHASVIAGKWERKKFEGVELNGKTLAILGMGRIGSEFAKRALAFGMRVLAYDPYLSAQRAQTLRVELKETIEAAVSEADFITLHMPLTKETKGMINAERIALMKPTRADRQLRARRTDRRSRRSPKPSIAAESRAPPSMSSNPSRRRPTTRSSACPTSSSLRTSAPRPPKPRKTSASKSPGRSATTSSMAASSMRSTCRTSTRRRCRRSGRSSRSPNRSAACSARWLPPSRNVLRVNYTGKVADLDTALISRAALKGFLERSSSEETVNFLNAPSMAERKGLRFTESRLPEAAEFTDLIELSVGREGERTTVAGTFFGKQPRIVRIAGKRMEVVPEGHLLLLENKDQPGMVGAYGTLLGKHGVEHRPHEPEPRHQGRHRLVVLTLDAPPSDPSSRKSGSCLTLPQCGCSACTSVLVARTAPTRVASWRPVFPAAATMSRLAPEPVGLKPVAAPAPRQSGAVALVARMATHRLHRSPGMATPRIGRAHGTALTV